MSSIKEKFAHQSLYTKIILAFFFGCIVVLLSWLVARVVFRETFVTLEKIAQPNPKLRLVSNLLVQVHHLDQVQRLGILQQSITRRPLRSMNRKPLPRHSTPCNSFTGATVYRCNVSTI